MKSYQRASQCIALVAMSAAAAIAALAAQNNDQKRHPTQRGAPAQTYHAARPQYPSNRNAPAYHYPSGSQAPKAPPTNDYGRRTLQSGPQHIQSAGPRQSYGAQHFQSGGPRQSYGAQHFQTGGFQRSHSSALTSRQFSLRNNVRVAAEPRSRSMTYTKPVAGGSLSMRTRYVRGRPVVTSAFIMRRANGVTTRTYLDGSRFEETSEYSRFRSPAGYTLTTYSTGLRRAEAPNGRLMYSEAYRATQINGVQNRVIERTVYRETILGRTVIYPTPIIRTYYPGFVNGVPYYVYRPVFYAPAYYRPFYFHVRRPFFVGIGCIFCPPPVVAWVNPPASYVDPLVLLGDLMIATAVADAQPPEDPNLLPPPDPEVAQLKAQVAQLQQQVDSEQASNAELHSEIQTLQSASANPSAAQPSGQPNGDNTEGGPAGATDTGAATVQRSSTPSLQKVVYRVPEDVRQQIHKQVKDDLTRQEQHHDLDWSDIVDSGQAKGYIFQVSDTIRTVDADGTDCSLSGGDMLKLDDSAAPNDPALRMRVVTARTASCPVGSVVSIAVEDAQGMLNDFNAREEGLMQKLQPQLMANNIRGNG